MPIHQRFTMAVFSLTVYAIYPVLIGLLAIHPANAGSNRLGYQRSDGLLIGDWCFSTAQTASNPQLLGLDCTQISGAVCKDEAGAQPTGSVCRCKDGYEGYTINGVERCRAKKDGTGAGAVTILTSAECQIDDDCHQYFPTAVCNPATSGPPNAFGKCGCPKDFIIDNPTTGKSCKAYDCKADNSFCTTYYGSNSKCLEQQGRMQCICNPGFYLLPFAAGSPQCQDAKSIACSAVAPDTCPSPLTCNTAKLKCDCGANRIITPAAGNPNVIECKAVSASTAQAGDTCDSTAGGNDCPPDATCQTVSPTLSMCVCKPYYKAVTGTDGRKVCKTYLGNCCKTNSDCGGTRVPTGVNNAGNPSSPVTAGPLTCLKLNNAARGVCACQTGYAWDWTTSPPGACTTTAVNC